PRGRGLEMVATKGWWAVPTLQLIQSVDCILQLQLQGWLGRVDIYVRCVHNSPISPYRRGEVKSLWEFYRAGFTIAFAIKISIALVVHSLDLS
ncbi:MAG: hypothetical protein OXT74_01345, partial [Candidatus Poribacteria bacterium]|nr:hypothetical protein [Candidatus Poribacteria bacterium]